MHEAGLSSTRGRKKWNLMEKDTIFRDAIILLQELLIESKDDEDKFMYKCNQLNMDAIINAGNRHAGVAILAPRKYKLELNG